MELNLNTKFEIGNRVFVIVKENRCWQKKHVMSAWGKGMFRTENIVALARNVTAEVRL